MKNKHLIGVFSEEEALLKAFRKMQEDKLEIKDVFTPYPIHEVLEKHGRKSKMTWMGWLYGLLASLGVLAFLVYTAVIDWPLNYGGKPSNSFPSFIVITIILTIFSITLLSLGTFSWRAKLWPSLEKTIWHERATDDKFVILVDCTRADAGKATSVMKESGAEEIIEK